MRYNTAAAFRQALERRLVDRSHRTGESLIRLRKLVVFDRLLARLRVAAPEGWVLKGALALDFHLRQRGRTTKDIDLVRRDDEESAITDLLAAQATDLGDFFTFAIERTVTRRAIDGAAVRYRARSDLAGRLFEEVLIDIGFSDPLCWQPEIRQGPDLLSFAGIEPTEVPTLPLEQQVAEKVHAYTGTYRNEQASSRVKDLIDLALIKTSMPLQAARLREALEVTFESRGLQALPPSLPPPPADWTVAYRKLATEVRLSPDLAVGHAEAAALLDPILDGRTKGRWQPDRDRWLE